MTNQYVLQHDKPRTIDDLFPRKYLAGKDLLPGNTTITITGISPEQVRPYGNEPETRWAVVFSPAINGMDRFFLSRTIANQIAAATGSRTLADWEGQQITIYPVPVKVTGKLKTAIRIRTTAPQTQATPTPATTRPTTSKDENGHRQQFYQIAGPAIAAGQITSIQVNDLVSRANREGYATALVELQGLL